MMSCLLIKSLLLDWIEKRKPTIETVVFGVGGTSFRWAYQRLKADNGKLDYDDLIDKTLALFGTRRRRQLGDL